MRISVIIPAHDLGSGILKCLDSIAAQDLDRSEYEVWIVLDSCTDDTEQVINDWHATCQDINIRTIQASCGSPGGARNVGLDNAVGEFIMFIDGDDYLVHNSAMTILLNAAQGHNAVRMTDHEISGRKLKFSKRLTIWLHFFARSLIGSDRFTDMILNEDFEFVKRIRNKPEYDEAIVNVPLYHYNYDSERMVERIFKALELSRERVAQGLPPVYVSDEFVPDETDYE